MSVLGVVLDHIGRKLWNTADGLPILTCTSTSAASPSLEM